MFNRRSKFRAFTLIELLMVMMIITIMVAVVAPKLSGFAMGRKASDEARTLVSLARYAQTEAISEGRVYRLNVDPAGRQFWLTAEQDGQFQPPQNEYGEKYDLPDGVSMDTDITPKQDGQYVQFQPSGRSESAKVNFTDRLNHSVTVLCASPTELFHIAQPGEETP
jgi:type II secretion system protein H